MGTVLILLSIGLLITATIASVSMTGHQFCQVVESRDSARNLAEASIADGLAQVQEHQAYGLAGADRRDIFVQGNVPKSFGYLTFNGESAVKLAMGFSSNHFFSNHSETGSEGRLIPRASAHLIGLGVCGSSRQQVEALVFKPPFSEGVSCAGRLQAKGMLLGGLRDPAAFAGTYADTPSTQKMAGHIFANGLGRDIVSLGESDVRGNVGAAGGIRVERSQVQGELRPHSPRRPIPRLNLQAVVSNMAQVEGHWNWRGPGASPARGGGDGSASKPWSGYRVIQGPLNYSGDLHLDGGAIYVKGDVNISGALVGKGCVIATGEARVAAGAGEVDKDRNVTLCATGNVTVSGRDRDHSFFQGLIYSEGDIRAENISVLGALVAPGPANAGHELGNVVLDQVNVYPCPRQVSVTVGTPFLPMQLNEHPPPPDSLSDGSYDAMTVRVDVSEKRDGMQLFDAYLYYAKDYGYRESPGARGWTGNARYFAQTKPYYRANGPETEPIAISGVEAEELAYQLNETVAKITHTRTEDGARCTYLTDPRRLVPAHRPLSGSNYAPGEIMSKIRSKIQEVATSGQGKVLDFNLTRQLPPQEQFRILLMRDLN